MNDHSHQMDEAEWAENKDCDAKKREHKYQWKHDIAAGVPSNTHAVCVHCGREVILDREGAHPPRDDRYNCYGLGEPL